MDSPGILDGRVEGLEDLRRHLTRGLERLPELYFDLDAVYTGVSSIAMTYRWPEGTRVCECTNTTPKSGSSAFRRCATGSPGEPEVARSASAARGKHSLPILQCPLYALVVVGNA
jgi:hypothetical protein